MKSIIKFYVEKLATIHRLDTIHTGNHATIKETWLSLAKKNSSGQGDGNQINSPNTKV